MPHFTNHLNLLNLRNPGSDNKELLCFPQPLDTPVSYMLKALINSILWDIITKECSKNNQFRGHDPH